MHFFNFEPLNMVDKVKKVNHRSTSKLLHNLHGTIGQNFDFNAIKVCCKKWYLVNV